jgi:hypothetical protein
MLAVFAVGAVASATASALEFFNSNGELILGLLNVESLGGASRLLGELGGSHVRITCNHVDDNGWIHNGLLNGILTGLGLILALYLSCSLVEPAGTECVVPNIHTLAHGYVITLSGKNDVEFTPAEGTTFAFINLEVCTKAKSLAGTYEVKGTAIALTNNTTSELEFEAGAPNNKLKFAGNPAELEGKDQVLMLGGGKIKVE